MRRGFFFFLFSKGETGKSETIKALQAHLFQPSNPLLDGRVGTEQVRDPRFPSWVRFDHECNHSMGYFQLTRP